MKIRQGFVSNSSSSSFLCIDEEPSISHVLLNNDQAEMALKRALDEIQDIISYLSPGDRKEKTIKKRDLLYDLIKNYRSHKVYMTSFLSDSSPDEYKYTGLYFAYRDGNHGGPYNTEDFVKLAEDIWILKEDYKIYYPGQQEFDFVKDEIKRR